MAVKKLSVFDIAKHLNESKRDNWLDHQYEYNTFMVNKILSMHSETINIANEMNLRWNLPKALQYEFYLTVIPKKKRYGKYVKASKDESLEKIKNEFKCNAKNARVIQELLAKEGISLEG